eukprot:4205595-Pyramimonas_sp.AAC.2
MGPMIGGPGSETFWRAATRIVVFMEARDAMQPPRVATPGVVRSCVFHPNKKQKKWKLPSEIPNVSQTHDEWSARRNEAKPKRPRRGGGVVPERGERSGGALERFLVLPPYGVGLG